MLTEERRAVLVGAVRECKNDSLLEEAFHLYGISDDDVDAKIDILIRAMGSPKYGFCGEPTNEEKYETLRCIFLSGTWQENGGR
jgi:hypothetical protein